MTTPATPNLKPTINKAAVSIDANSTNYKVVAILFNSKAEGRFIDSNVFENISFETNYSSLLLMGNMTLVNENNTDIFNKINLKNSPLSNINETGDGQLFLKIKIFYKNKNNKEVILLDKYFVVKNKMDTVQASRRQTVYYFIDIIYNHLNYKRQTWSTDLLNDRPRINQYGHEEVNAGLALKHLLRKFTEQEDIIDEENWDDGIGALYYTLPNNEPALVGIKEILKSYVSSEKDSGILTYYNGKFQLRSIKKHISELYKKQNNNIEFSSSLAAAFKIQTNDFNEEYSTNEAIDIFGKKFEYIPLALSNINFTDVQPDSTVSSLVKNEVIQFDIKNKEFVFHSDEGTLEKVEEVTGLDMLPNGKDNKLNIDSNQRYNIKNKMLIMSDIDSIKYYGTVKLQKELFNNLSKASFTTTGNVNFNAHKFVYMTLDLRLKNEYARKLPGFWYIISNVTTLTKGSYTSTIECVKLDKPK